MPSLFCQKIGESIAFKSTLSNSTLCFNFLDDTCFSFKAFKRPKITTIKIGDIKNIELIKDLYLSKKPMAELIILKSLISFGIDKLYSLSFFWSKIYSNSLFKTTSAPICFLFKILKALYPTFNPILSKDKILPPTTPLLTNKESLTKIGSLNDLIADSTSLLL